MSGIIIGTAGHVDHGKTTLIRLLTGHDTDRLPEEKKRGISIDLGFAWMDLPGGDKAGIIDVPGHERFIGNMLAGSAHIDIALLVIAADEGIMPQTREHAAILDLLGVKRGLIVVSKADLVDDEWLEMLTLELREFFQGTVFAQAPVIPVSSVSMRGIDELKACIVQMAGQLQKNQPAANAGEGLYLPVDRVFSVSGFGTVATGTIHSGSIAVGAWLEILPQALPVRVRGIQVHGCSVETAEHGQRVALNISGATVAQFKRGSVFVLPGRVDAVSSFVARFRMLAKEGNTVASSNRIRVHIGTDEITARMRLLEKDALTAGETSLVQVMLDRPAVVMAGLKYIIRSWDAQRTIGGGEILSAAAGRLKRQNDEILDRYRLQQSGDALGQLRKEIAQGWVWQAAGHNGQDGQDGQALWQELVASGWAVALTKDAVAAKHRIEEFTARLEGLLGVYHNENPLREGMQREQARKAISASLDKKSFDLLLAASEKAGRIKIAGNLLRLEGFRPEFPGVWGDVRASIRAELISSPYSPPLTAQLRGIAACDTARFNEVLAAMRKNGEIVEVAAGMVFLPETLVAVGNWLAGYFAQQATLEIGALRDAFATSRKYAVALLEYFDAQGMTRREGDYRTAGDKMKSIR